MKVIVAAFNYAAHNKVFKYPLDALREPVVFIKPDSAILKNGKPFFIPDDLGRINYGMHLVAKVCRLGKDIPERFAYRYYDELTVGVDFRAEDMLDKCRKEGLPWDMATGFDNSAVLGQFISKEKVSGPQLSLHVDGEQLQAGDISDALFSIDHIISYLSKLYTFKIGDLIYAGIPGNMTEAAINQHIEGYLNDEKLLDFHLR